MLKAADPEEGFDLTLLSTVEKDREGFAVPQCGIPAPSTEATQKFTVEASYDPFRGEKIKFRMNGFGQYTSSEQEGKKKTAQERGEDGGQIRAEVDAMGNIVCYTYSVWGNVATITDFPDGPGSPRGVTQTFVYDVDRPEQYDQTFNQLVEKTDGIGRVTTNALDARGNILVTTITDPSPPEGNPTSSTKRYDYYENGLVSLYTDPRGNQTQYLYDTRGRQTEIRYTDGSQFFGYADNSGNTTQIIDPNGHEVTMEYSPMNHLRYTRQTVTDGQTSQSREFVAETRYDAAGNQVVNIDRDGYESTWLYDELNRAVEPSPTPSKPATPRSASPCTPPASISSSRFRRLARSCRRNRRGSSRSSDRACSSIPWIEDSPPSPPAPPGFCRTARGRWTPGPAGPSSGRWARRRSGLR